MKNKYSQIARAPHQVSFDITNKCNLRCLHCFNNSGENDVVNNELTDEEVLTFIRSVAPMSLYNICFCGGEPLIRKDLVVSCIKILKSQENHQTHCSMVTNGLLATPEVLTELEESGLDAIQFSLDGMKCSHDKLRNKCGAFEAVLKAIEYVITKTKLHLSIAFTPTAFNLDDFPAVYETITNFCANSHRKNSTERVDLRLQPLMLLGRAKQNSGMVPTDWQYRKLVHDIHERECDIHNKYVEMKWGDPIDHLFRFRDKSNFIDQCVAHANGDIVVSAYLPLVVGNIRKHSLLEYWEQGLNDVWATNIVQYLTAQMQSVKDMERVTASIADINMNDGLYIDLIDNDLNDLNLIKDVILG